MLEKTKSPNCDSLTADADTKLKQFHILKKRDKKEKQLKHYRR
jgi:hypothetical protein